MTDEFVDICDESNNLLGLRKLKSEAHHDGTWHRSAHIWIYNSKSEVLLQLRSKNKHLYPDVWDISAAGHVTAGEDALTAGLREAEEELGLNINKDDLFFWMTRKHQAIFRDLKDNEFYNIYLYKFDGDDKKLKLQNEEVQEIKFIPIDEIKMKLKLHPDKFVPHGDYWIEVLDEIQKKLTQK